MLYSCWLFRIQHAEAINTIFGRFLFLLYKFDFLGPFCLFKARLERNEYDLALEDFEKVVELEPDNKAAKNQILLCKQRKKQFLEREKKLYANMFQKLLSSKVG